MGSHAPQECVGRRTHNIRYFSTYISNGNHPNYDELPVISLLENNHLLKPNSIEPTIGQVCLTGRAPAGRSSNRCIISFFTCQECHSRLQQLLMQRLTLHLSSRPLLILNMMSQSLLLDKFATVLILILGSPQC